MDFTTRDFNKVISLTSKEENAVKSIYPLKSLQSLMLQVVGPQTKIAKNEINEIGAVPVVTQEVEKQISGYTDNVQPIIDLPLIVFGDHSCSFKYVDFQFVRGADGTQLIKLNNEVKAKYVFEYLKTVKIENSNKYERHFKYLKNILVPIPPISIQESIISECEAIDKDYNNSRMSIETYRQKIAEIFDRLEVVSGNLEVKINELCNYITERTSDIDMATYITTDNMLQNCEGIRPYDGANNITSAIAYKKGDILLSNIRPYLKKIWQADRDGSCSPDVLVLRPNTEKVDNQFLYYSLRRDAFFDYIMNEAGTKGLKMPRGNKEGIINYTIALPSKVEQKRIVSEISHWDALIENAKTLMDNCAIRKKVVLESII